MTLISTGNTRAFTLIELLVSVGIFALMTSLVVAKYGNFNQSVLLTNLAYDVALTIRTAQTYGLSVKNSSETATDFAYGYGVRFDSDPTVDSNTGNPMNKQIVFFSDNNSNSANKNDGIYTAYSGGANPYDTAVSTYAIKRGAYVSDMCTGSPTNCVALPSNVAHHIDITFKRPDPSASICVDSYAGAACSKATYVELTVKGTDGSTRVISVRDNGQITVKN